jgi:hypothetical protein
MEVCVYANRRKARSMYMLAGGTDASNTDAYATAPTETNNWITTGPHVMIVNAGEMMSGYPTDPKVATRNWGGDLPPLSAE